MTKDEALNLALDFITESNRSSQFWLVPASNLNKTVTAIREALAQPEQEPVGWFDKELNTIKWKDGLRNCNLADQQPIYTAPPQRKPLTDEEIVAINDKRYNLAYRDFDADIAIAREIEAAHGIKENT